MAPVTMNGLTNGHGPAPNGSGATLNGFSSISEAGQAKFSAEDQDTVLRQTVSTTRHKFINEHQITDVTARHIDTMSAVTFIQYLDNQRIIHCPKHGSSFDKVLQFAQFFAIQVEMYSEVASAFLEGSEAAAQLIWAACRILIEMGPKHAQDVEAAFSVLNNAASSLSFFLQQKQPLSLTLKVREQFGDVFNSLLILVRDVALHYWTQTTTRTTFTIHHEFNQVFQKQIGLFYAHREHAIEALWTSKAGKGAAHIKAISRWLGINDDVMQTSSHDLAATRNRRHEFTCKWFQSTLLDFSRGTDRILVVTGAASGGKSFLASWIMERLQRPLGKKKYDTLEVFLEKDLPIQITGIAIAKSIVSQLLQRSIGDVELLEALWHIHNMSFGSATIQSLEDKLWSAIHNSFENLPSTDFMIVVNGLDERCTAEVASVFGQRLHQLAKGHSCIKIIVLARSANFFPKSSIRERRLTSDDTLHDITLITRPALVSCQHFLAHDSKAQEDIIEKIVRLAKGDYLAARLMVNALALESSIDGFKNVLKSYKESSGVSEQLVDQAISRIIKDSSKTDGCLILSWLLVAKRPLMVDEISSLLQIHRKTDMPIGHKFDADTVKSLCGNVVIVQSGIVRLAHTAFRDHLVKLSKDGKEFPQLSSCNASFTKLLLGYCKVRLTASIEPTYELSDEFHGASPFAQDSLLRYATIYWVDHFKESSLYHDTGPLDLSADFKAAFPSSVQLVLMEWSLWKVHFPLSERFHMHQLALSVRKHTFSAPEKSILQTLILCGHSLKIQRNRTEGATYFYHASQLCKSIYESYQAVTVSCITTFLEMTASVSASSRTEVITHREELLITIVELYKQRWGQTSDLVVKYLRVLAELYVSIKETHKSEKIWQQVREIMITVHGMGSIEERSVCKHFGGSVTESRSHEETVEYEVDIFAEHSHLAIWNVDRIAALLELAWKYEARGDFVQAEVYFLMLWTGIIEHSHSGFIGIDIHISVLHVALQYIRFLRIHHRHEDACAILICIWAEYERHQFESETLFVQLLAVGEIMLELKLYTMALSVFRRCSTWFQSREIHVHFSSCQTLITKTVKEITIASSTTTSESRSSSSTSESTSRSSSTTSTKSETTMREVFESSITKKTVTKETLSICTNITSLYIQQERWSKAIEVTSKSLELIWRSVITGGGMCALPRDFGLEAIEIAILLASCHARIHHCHEAEMLYLRIFRACINSCQIQDIRFVKSYEALIAFYEVHGQWHKLVEIYREVLEKSRKRLGASHATTIAILYKLGRICSVHGFGSASIFYEEIITVLNTETVICHHGSLDAMKYLCRFYFEEGRWESLNAICRTLWQVWTTSHHEYSFDAEFIAVLYMRYMYVLEHHSHCDFEIIRKISKQYWKTCSAAFGAQSSTTMSALFELATICERREEYRHETIEYYEEIIKTSTSTSSSSSTTTISTQTITTITERLSNVYIHECSSTTVTSTMIERAIRVLSQRFEHSKTTYGCAHMESLVILREIIQMHYKLKTKTTRAIVEKLLFESIISIITVTKASELLYEAAKYIAKMYIDFEIREAGRAKFKEIHLQVMANTCGFAHKNELKMDVHIGRSAYVFLVVFEELICGLSISSYTKILADFLTETILWQSYSACLKSEKNFEVVLAAGARLYVFLKKTSRKEQLLVVQNELHKRFVIKWGTVFKEKSEASLLFFTRLLMFLGSTTYHIQLGTAACKSSYDQIKELLLAKEYQAAYDVAGCASRFLESYGAYTHRQNLGPLFKLSSLISLRDMKIPTNAMDPALFEAFLKLSRDIIDEVLKLGKQSNVNFIRLNHAELNDLISLLGFQENYIELKWLLENLWGSREQHKKTNNEIITIGTLLAQVYQLLGNTKDAIVLLSDRISYNVDLVYSPLHPQSLSVSELLSQLYTEAKRYKEAMRIHENILRLVIEGDDDDDDTVDVLEPPRARKHYNCLRAAYLRNQGWEKSPAVYEAIIKELLKMQAYAGHDAFKGAQGIEQWNLKNNMGSEGAFVKPKNWGFVVAATEVDDDYYFGRVDYIPGRLLIEKEMGNGFVSGKEPNGGGGTVMTPGRVPMSPLPVEDGMLSPASDKAVKKRRSFLRKVSDHWGLSIPKPERVAK